MSPITDGFHRHQRRMATVLCEDIRWTDLNPGPRENGYRWAAKGYAATPGREERCNYFISLDVGTEWITWNFFPRRKNTEFRFRTENILVHAKMIAMKKVIIFADEDSCRGNAAVSDILEAHSKLDIGRFRRDAPNTNQFTFLSTGRCLCLSSATSSTTLQMILERPGYHFWADSTRYMQNHFLPFFLRFIFVFSLTQPYSLSPVSTSPHVRSHGILRAHLLHS